MEPVLRFDGRLHRQCADSQATTIGVRNLLNMSFPPALFGPARLR